MIARLVFPIPLDQAFSYEIPETWNLRPGSRALAPFGKSEREGLVVEILEKEETSSYEIKTLKKQIDELPLLDACHLDLARWLADTCFCSLGEACFTMIPQAKREKELVFPEYENLNPKALVLSQEQKVALEALKTQPEAWFYLWGITGSGKTEVYFQAAQEVLDSGKSVLLLVPEIALSNQMVLMMESRFGANCAVLHSRLSPSQRLGQWRKIQGGEIHLVIGARSAVFAPLKNLGLIILDEEHEGTYKSSSSPRYHARQVAMYRSNKETCGLLLGSATPSLEAWHQIQQGKLKLLTLSTRLAGGTLPPIEIIDMNASDSSLSPRLQDELIKTKELGKQTILFLNRRGFSYFFRCKTCSYELLCPHCSVSLTYHKERNLMICHYCGHTQRPLTVCPSCGSLDLAYAGIGTEKVEEDLARLFPDYTIARLDGDNARKKGVLEETLETFRTGKIDILLGTQMIAKGLNFPGLRLVGIVNADVGLKMPDFRALERSHALISQVAGRAGRYQEDGLVLIQTFSPQNPGIRFAQNHDLEGFYRYELEQRKALRFPPFVRMTRLVFRSAKADKALHDAKEFLRNKGRNLGRACEVLGPAEAAIFKINGSYRYQILISHQSQKYISGLLKEALKNWTPSSGVYLEIDPDPVSIL